MSAQAELAPDASPSASGGRAGVAAAWAFVALVAVLALATLFRGSAPGGDLVVTLVLFVAWFVLGTLWLVWCVIELVQWRRRRARDGSRSRVIALVVAAVVPALAAGLLLGDVPMRARFAVAEGAMTTHAEQTLRTQDQDDPAAIDQCVGSYCFDVVYVLRDAVYYGSTTGIFGEEGFVFSPDGRPEPNRERAQDGDWQFSDYGDGWYWYFVQE